MSILNYSVDILRRTIPRFGSSLSHVTTYTRELPISIERMYENAIDGEHLPFLHSSSFSKIDIIDSGDWGWKANAALQPESFLTSMVLELRLDRENHRWITKTLSGLGKGTEIWTHAIPLEENKIKVIVDFYVPKLPGFLKSKYATQYQYIYAKLYDEDLWMMAGRQHALNKLDAVKSTDPKESMVLGKLVEVKERLPMTFEFNNQPYRLIEHNDTLIAHAMTCPHMLGPLDDAEVEEGVLVCPWHGYKFDIVSRKCISGQKCRLAPAPVVVVDKESNEVLVKKNG